MIEQLKPIYLYLHIPRTGGTTFQYSVGHPAELKNDRWLKHYLYVDPWSEVAYEDWNIPRLSKRTAEQQKKLIIVSGHSVFCNSHKWIRERRVPRILTTIRHPIERLLSDFNYRYTKEKLCQDKQLFSSTTPKMNEWAYRQQKSSSDYETLWEYYQDCTFQHNLQCKWIVKSFLTRERDTWKRHADYIFGPDAGITNDQAVPLTWPEWMMFESGDFDWYELASSFFKEIWYVGTTENLENDISRFTKHAGLENTYKFSNESVERYWTMDDVRQQPDIDKLIKAEKHDFKLYEEAKKWKRPF